MSDERPSRAVDRLIAAAAGLAATIETTATLLQERADLLQERGSTPNADLISLADAAERTGRHPEVLRRWCADGRLPAVRLGRTWWITVETLAMLLSHSARARPRFPAA